MKALIFNSGIGKRMGELTIEKPKCLTTLYNGETILERQIRILKSLGITEFIITVGPFKEMIMEETSRFSGVNFTFVPNDNYENSNYILSFYNTKELIDDDILMLHGDLCFEGSIIYRLLSSDVENAALYNPAMLLPRKDFKGRVIDGKLAEVSVDILDNDCFAFQPIYKLKRETAVLWLNKVSEYVEAGKINCYAEEALNEILLGLDIELISYEGIFVSELDDVEDLKTVNFELSRIDGQRLREYTESSNVYTPSEVQAEKVSVIDFIKTRPVLLLIIISNVFAYILCSKIGGNQYANGGINYEHVVNNHEYGRIISYMFLHSGFEHMFFNMTALFATGMLLEKKLGSLRFGIIYFLSGICGGVFSLVMSHMNNPESLRYSVGASAAVYGTFSAIVFLRIKGRKDASKLDLLKAVAVIVVYAILTKTANVDIYGHIGGAIFGGASVFIICTNRWAKVVENKFAKYLAIILTVILCIVGVGEAGFGEKVKQISDKRVDFVKEQLIFDDSEVTLGECIDEFFLESDWHAFTSQNNAQVVQFDGVTYYKGNKSQILIQFIVYNNMQNYRVGYFEIDGEAKTGDDLNAFMTECKRQYENVHSK